MEKKKKIKTGNETSYPAGRVLLPAVFIFAVLRHRRVVNQDEAGGARNDGRLLPGLAEGRGFAACGRGEQGVAFSAFCAVARRCRVTAWEVLKFHSVTAFDTIAAARLQAELSDCSVHHRESARGIETRPL